MTAIERRLLVEVMEELGYVVEPVPDAGVALALLEDGVIVDLLLSDHRMPGMTGVDLARVVSARWPLVRTVLLTAYGDDPTCDEAMDARAVTVLAKPLSVVDFERVIEDFAS